MAVGQYTRNLFVLTLIGSFAYTVYPLPFSSSVEQRRPDISNSSNGNNNIPLLLEDSLQSSLTSLDKKYPFWQPGCNQHHQRHRRSLKQVRQVLNIVVKKLNQTFHNHISKLYKEPMTEIPKYTWLPANPGKKMRDATLNKSYRVFYNKLQEYAIILHSLNRTGPPAGYDPHQFRHAERQKIINSIAELITQLLCELEYSMKGKVDSVNLENFENVIPSNLNQTQLYVYDMATFNAYKKFLMSWKRLLHKGKKRGRNKNRRQNGDDNRKKNKKNQKKNHMDQKKRKAQRDDKLEISNKRKNKKVPGKQQKKQPE